MSKKCHETFYTGKIKKKRSTKIKTKPFRTKQIRIKLTMLHYIACENMV